jgi:hypothetical protein
LGLLLVLITMFWAESKIELKQARMKKNIRKLKGIG